MTNTKASVNVEIDADINILATTLLGRMGLDQATAIDMFFRQIIAERRFPFQPVAAPTLDELIVAAAMESTHETVELATDLDGNILVDRVLHPGIHDWAANG
ncbi:MAG: type II toxin-antitoxin system RelB/DinJ family antitoxin [Treponema sp.]|nr:type II toxin-antitoxin system RelB/DinJ family antitoxin [Treponema sp.]